MNSPETSPSIYFSDDDTTDDKLNKIMTLLANNTLRQDRTEDQVKVLSRLNERIETIEDVEKDFIKSTARYNKGNMRTVNLYDNDNYDCCVLL